MQPGDPTAAHLLIGYAGGCVAIAIPHRPSETPAPQPAEHAVADATVTEAAPTNNGEQLAADEGATTEPQQQQQGSTETAEATDAPAAASSVPSTPAKEATEKRATLKFKAALTRSLRRTDTTNQTVRFMSLTRIASGQGVTYE